jgi:uncharacterized phage protein (TIGR01671 family)
MRTIKFRAWDKDNKEMVYQGNNAGHNNGVMEARICFDELSETIARHYGDEEWIHLEDVDLMQFTGLHDRLGKEIYESDIIKTTCLGKEIIGTIKYADRWCQFYLGTRNSHGVPIALDSVHQWYYGNEDDDPCTTTIAEVIGNIYSNPELLEAK